MKLSDYARAQGVSYRTAWSWWKKGIILTRLGAKYIEILLAQTV